jgi:phage shock protein PspC (stress-responsive transcriptional regulator)
MLIVSSSQALGQTLALLATFLGIGVIVNLLIVYIVAQVIAEHKQNQEHDPGAGQETVP